jgi:hypothetical protein
LLGTSAFEVVHFAFAFYGFEVYNVLVNPNNPLVRTVLTTMVESGDYFFFALTRTALPPYSARKSGKRNLVGLTTNLPRIQCSTTTETQYRRAVSAFEKHPQPPGVMLHWVCQDSVEYLDLTRDRLKLTPT